MADTLLVDPYNESTHVVDGSTYMGGLVAAPVQERVIARIRSHARFLVWPSIVLISAVGAAGYFFERFDAQWVNVLIISGTVAVVFFAWFIPLLFWLSRRYTITTRRIIFRHGFFVRVRHELLHSRGYQISVRQNSLQIIFRSGDVYITVGRDQPIIFRDVPRVVLVHEALTDLVEENRHVIGTNPHVKDPI
jgi:membrane protein YdbS with pleckstrin-like domain